MLSSFKENHFSLHRLCLHGGLCVELATWQERKDKNKITVKYVNERCSYLTFFTDHNDIFKNHFSTSAFVFFNNL